MQTYGMPQPSPVYGMPTVPYADFLTRFIAYFIDGLIVAVGEAIILGIVAVMVGVVAGASGRDSGAGGAAAALFILVYALIFVLVVGYFSYLESSEKQATFGKQILGLKVTTVDGNRLTFANALGRTLAKLFLIAVCFLLPLTMLFTDRKQALHDMIAGTIVVRP